MDGLPDLPPNVPAKIGGVDVDTLLDMIANGAYLKDLSAITGLRKQRLSEILRHHPDYPAAKEASCESQLDEAYEDIRAAREVADIACARERWRAATWRAEREAPHRWGQHKILHVDNNDDLGDRLRRAKQRLEREEKVVSEQPKQSNAAPRLPEDNAKPDAKDT